ncbi:MAG: dTDP-4-dehydro-6-deoxyglucose aminotransferase [Verrucomicrobia bacterium]|nr:dTDP-4-dehydro-6-deoxyglucose aminotransferase [Verrucomicrobiota bacterium]
MKSNQSGALHVGRPNMGNRRDFLRRVDEILDRRWLSNHGPVVQEFEKRIAEILGVKHVVAMCNATAGIEIACHALGLKGEVIVPSYTFIATAHALQWQGITPVFADMDPRTHNLNPEKIEKLITPKTTGIIGVHVWGRGCDTEAIEKVASKHRLKVMYDASHAFGCSFKGQMIGTFGECEVFSFHATKFINCLEGGVVTTNHDQLAHQMRMMTNFGFTGYDRVEYLGINGKMNEISAAMGLTNLEAMQAIIETNKKNYEHYRDQLRNIPGVKLVEYNPAERNNYQYVVIEVDPSVCRRGRDELIEALHAENIIARKYFWPGCHRMEPYKSLFPDAYLTLSETEKISANVIVLPTGQQIEDSDLKRICGIIRSACEA